MTDAGPSPAPSTLGETPHGKAPTKETAPESDTDHPKTKAITLEDTLSLGSSDSLPKVPFK